MKRSLVFVCALASCSRFGPSEGPPNASGPGEADAAAAVDAGDPIAPGTVGTITREKDRALAVAVNGTTIYWVSAYDSRIARANKTTPRDIEVVATRPGQTITALAVDSTSVDWLESGPDDDGGSSSRLMTRDAVGVHPVLWSTRSLGRLALDATIVAATGPDGIRIVNRSTGDWYLDGLALDSNGLAVEGGSIFYTWGPTIDHLTPGILPTRVIEGLASPREVIGRGGRLYASVSNATGNAIVSMDSKLVNASADAATTVVTTGPGRIYFAVEGAGVVWGNVEGGTIQRVAGAGAPPTPVADRIPGINALAADGDGVYWSADDGSVAWARR